MPIFFRKKKIQYSTAVILYISLSRTFLLLQESISPWCYSVSVQCTCMHVCKRSKFSDIRSAQYQQHSLEMPLLCWCRRGDLEALVAICCRNWYWLLLAVTVQLIWRGRVTLRIVLGWSWHSTGRSCWLGHRLCYSLLRQWRGPLLQSLVRCWGYCRHVKPLFPGHGIPHVCVQNSLVLASKVLKTNRKVYSHFNTSS